MRIEGVLKSWNDERGFGFIEPVLGGQDVFVHIKAFAPGGGRPQEGLRLTFEIESSATGKKRAKNVQPDLRYARSARARRYRDSPVQWGTASYFAIPVFAAVFLLAGVLWHIPGWVGGFYLTASVVCFVVYAADKSAAVAGRRRVSEMTLIMLGLAGGWPGAIVAQQLLRHKSNKASFRSTFWGSVVLNVLGFVLLSSPVLSLLMRR